MEVVTRGRTFFKTDGEKEKGRKRDLTMMLFFGPQRGLQSEPWKACVGGHITTGKHVEVYCMLDPSSKRTWACLKDQFQLLSFLSWGRVTRVISDKGTTVG